MAHCLYFAELDQSLDLLDTSERSDDESSGLVDPPALIIEEIADSLNVKKLREKLTIDDYNEKVKAQELKDMKQKIGATKTIWTKEEDTVENTIRKLTVMTLSAPGKWNFFGLMVKSLRHQLMASAELREEFKNIVANAKEHEDEPDFTGIIEFLDKVTEKQSS